MFAERNKNQQSLIPGSHLWTNPSNYLENLQRGVKIDCTFWLQSHCATFKKIENKIYVYGTRPKFLKFDLGKPFMDKPVKLSRKLTERSENWLQFLIAVTFRKIEIKIYVYGTRPNFLKVDLGKPFMDKLVKLSQKLTERRKNWLQFLIAVTLSYISKNIN